MSLELFTIVKVNNLHTNQNHILIFNQSYISPFLYLPTISLVPPLLRYLNTNINRCFSNATNHNMLLRFITLCYLDTL